MTWKSKIAYTTAAVALALSQSVLGVNHVRLEHAERLTFDQDKLPDAQVLMDNVRFSHDGAIMTCDSAHFFIALPHCALPQPHLCCTLLFSTTTSSRTSPYTSSTSFFIKQKNAQKLSCQKTKPYLCTHKTKTTVLLVKSRQVFPQGEMVEWSITTVLKTVVPRGTGGSNPSLSAKSCKSKDLQDFFCTFK